MAFFCRANPVAVYPDGMPGRRRQCILSGSCRLSYLRRTDPDDLVHITLFLGNPTTPAKIERQA